MERPPAGCAELISGIKAYQGAKATKALTAACFVAGTLVATKDGYKPIEQIKAGDLVWSENPETGEKGLKKVEEAYIRQTNQLVHIKVDGQNITTTPEHPFWVPQKGWTNAIELRAGDILVLQNGKYVTVEQVQHEILESPATVYNFRVADFHTYYVTNSAILVHNANCGRIVNVTKQNSSIWQGLKSGKNGLRISGSGNKLKYYSWDNLHNEIEVFDKLGRHLGAMDPATGNMIKAAVKGRTLW